MFEVEILASFSAIKCQSLVSYLTKNTGKLVSRLWIDKSERISEALASVHETSKHSFETDCASWQFLESDFSGGGAE